MPLLELQRRMAEDVRRPLTADHEMRQTTNDGASIGAIAASYIRPNDRLSSFERLEIYNRQYWFRLISAVSEDFPTLNAWLGPRRFDRLILAYLNENPSTSWTLRDLGAKLPGFLGAHPELTGRRHRLAVDVARLSIGNIGHHLRRRRYKRSVRSRAFLFNRISNCLHSAIRSTASCSPLRNAHRRRKS